ncbi:hypothetical protein N44_00857 [Microcystis aeruginosa NIES-44]|uniref:Uncharacterized protein n=1 Tax=Microcystis aeruginosa NIES-44 TaxID=449439 RepID=A0A0A1VRQ5_MICAE|nr:hypothetical protein N44_00857 [Microcystis aeruginosa NIES-44]
MELIFSSLPFFSDRLSAASGLPGDNFRLSIEICQLSYNNRLCLFHPKED